MQIVGNAKVSGTFILPTLIEIDSITELEREVFGPVLHFVRYRRDDLDGLLARIHGTGYGLTMGLHTRIDETIDRVVAASHAGNLYVNRNMVGAVVGVQPFGGEGLSGTGPKAGGPLYLYRLLAQRPEHALATALAGCGVALEAPAASATSGDQALRALRAWALESRSEGAAGLAVLCDRFASLARSGAAAVLAGPTGERNVYRLLPRQRVLGLAADDRDRLVQLAALLASGCQAVWPASARELLARLPEPVQARVALAEDWTRPELRFDAVLLHGTAGELAAVQAVLANRPGPVVGVERLAPGSEALPLERLVVERALSVNTAAAGGNASLMTIG